MTRRRSAGVLLVVGALVALVVSLSARAEPVPVPYPLVKVTTKSGSVQRVTYVPIGHVPVAIDVDDGGTAGMLKPDIDVSVGAISVEDLPQGKLVVPSFSVTRNQLALLQGRPAPPLELSAEIAIVDAASILGPPLPNLPPDRIATIDVGFSTPAGGRAPPRLTMKLTGPIQEGFTNPLQARVETPGYEAPLDLHAFVRTKTLEADFVLAFDPMPPRIEFTEDPRPDGLDFFAKIDGDLDVDLRGTAVLKNFAKKTHKEIGARIERLPRTVELHHTTTSKQTFAEYRYTSPLGKPDLEATYREYELDGPLITDAMVRAGGLPPAMSALLDYVPGDGEEERSIDHVKAQVLDGEQIDVLDVAARNFAGPEDPLPEAPAAGPRQQIEAAVRLMPDGSRRWRATGHVEGVRSVEYARTGPKHDGLDLHTDIGDGKRPLRVVLDLDDRGPGAPPDARGLRVDSTIQPLPATVHASYDAAQEDVPGKPLEVLYEPSAAADIDADVHIARGEHSACGQPEVTCAQASVDDLPPPRLKAVVPTEDGADYVLSNDGPWYLRPDVRAVVDNTPAEPAKRRWVDVSVRDVPAEARGRIRTSDTEAKELRLAEFHSCAYNFETSSCAGTESALSNVTFTVRRSPEREGLPVRPPVAAQHVTMLERNGQTEVTGSVDDVREVVVRRRPGSDEQPGTIGFRVRAGAGEQLDVALDEKDTAEQLERKVDVTVDNLPEAFSGCVRTSSEGPALPHPGDDLMSKCELDLPAVPDDAEAPVTPLAVHYRASTKSVVRADVHQRAPDEDEGGELVTTNVHAVVDAVPEEFLTAVVPPLKPKKQSDPSRDLRVGYDASSEIDAVDLTFARLVGDTTCGDGRAGVKSLCLDTRLEKIQKSLRAHLDDQQGRRELRVETAPVDDPAKRLDIRRLGLALADPVVKRRVSLDGQVLGVPERFKVTLVDPPVPDGPVEEDPSDEDKKSKTGRVRFDACPGPGWEDAENPDDASCKGIGLVNVTYRDALGTDLLPGAGLSLDQIANEPPSDRIELVDREAGKRVRARVSDVRAVQFSRLTDGDDKTTPVLRLLAAAGTGDPDDVLNVKVDRVLGSARQFVDATVEQAPRSVEVCFRPPAKPDGVGFCGSRGESFTAVQAKTGDVGGDARPDIELRRLTMRNEKGEVVAAKGRIEDLAERVDVLFHKGESEQDKELIVEGHHRDDEDGAPPVAVAKRVTLEVGTFAGALEKGYPFAPLQQTGDRDILSPALADDIAEDDGAHNYVKLAKTPERLYVAASVPAPERLAIAPRPCEVSANAAPARFPAGMAQYTCIQADAADGRRLGLAVRLLDESGNAVALEEGRISAMPDGEGGLQATLAKTAADAKTHPVCEKDVPLPCRPPLLTVVAPRAAGSPPLLRAILSVGPQAVIGDLRKAKPEDEMSRRTLFDERPGEWGDDNDGARIKLGKGAEGTAIRAGLNLIVPRYLDLDSPTVVTGDNDAVKTFDDIALRLAASDEGPLGVEGPLPEPVHDLGRVALFSTDLGAAAANKEAAPADLVLAGAPPETDVVDPQNPDDDIDYGPEHLPGPDDWDRGFVAPGYLDARIFLRTDPEAFDFFLDPKANGYDPEERTAERLFVQADTRTSLPLDLALRLDDPAKLIDNRAQTRVAGTNMTVRNIPGLGSGVSDYDAPTFRLRAALDTAVPKEPKRNGVCPDVEDGGKDGTPVGGDALQKLLTGCIYGPNLGPDGHVGWIDAHLDAQPETAMPARRLEAFVQITNGATVQARGFETSTGDQLEGTAEFSLHGGIRLAPFNVGLELGLTPLGLGVVSGAVVLGSATGLIGGLGPALLEILGTVGTNTNEWRLDGDLVVDAHADNVKGTLLRQLGTRVRARAEQTGQITADIDALARIRHRTHVLRTSREAGPMERDSHVVQDGQIFVSYWNCDSSDFQDVLHAAPGKDAARVVHLKGIPGELDTLLFLARRFKYCKQPVPKFGDLKHPLPTFTPEGRPVDGSPAEEIGPVPANESDGTQLNNTTDLDIKDGEQRVLCQTVTLHSLIVRPGGTVRVGGPGETADPLQGEDVECTGRLAISAERIVVERAGGKRGVISATAAAPQPGQASAPGAGGGAGGNGTGGESGAGDEGGIFLAFGSLLDHLGSSGGFDPATQRARGGGALLLEGSERVIVDGEIHVDGGPGGAGDAGDCGVAAGGGGSGGSLFVRGARVRVGGDGVISASGGPGGTGVSSAGGGGGAPGRLVVQAGVYANDGAVKATSGGGGAGNGCAAGQPGLPPAAEVGTFASGLVATAVRMQPDAWIGREPGKDSGRIKAGLRGLSDKNGRLQILWCKREADHGADPALVDPFVFEKATLEGFLDNGDCLAVEKFDGPNEGEDNDEYRKDFEFEVEEGQVGISAMAARPIDPEDETTICDTPQAPCEFQPVPPPVASARFLVDLTPPVVNAEPLNGLTNCTATEARCVRDGLVELDITAHDRRPKDNRELSGVRRVECRVGPEVLGECGPGKPVQVDLSDFVGPVVLTVRAYDRAGNFADHDLPWFIDKTPPAAPEIEVSQDVQPINGWLPKLPAITATASDDNHFGPAPIELVVDGVPTRCGTVHDGGKQATCTPGQVAEILPEGGFIEFHARAVDLLGNVSQQSDSDPETPGRQAVKLRVDGKAPTSALDLGPRRPDGNAGWYRTEPVIAFGAIDNDGGSGVDPAKEGSGVRYRIDGGEWAPWTPASDATMPEGKHEICWYATDVTFNKEDGGEPDDGNCKVVRVDVTAPEPELSLPNPGGKEDWHVDPPTAKFGATDAGGSGLAETAVQLDGDEWQEIGELELERGVHVVRLRAGDGAGNTSVIEREVRVDPDDPVADLVPWVPAPNGQGWLRGLAHMALGMTDRRGGSGAAGGSTSLDGEPFVPYEAEVIVPEGIHALSGRASDRAGRTSGESKRSFRIDLTAPTSSHSGPAPAALLLPGQKTSLGFTAGGTGTPRVRVRVHIYADLLGQRVRTIPAPGTYADGWRDAGAGSVTWDGKYDDGTGALPGTYRYRVSVTDQAGNTAISTEGQPIVVGLTFPPGVVTGTLGIVGGVTGTLGF